jgi:hypothetical protein
MTVRNCVTRPGELEEANRLLSPGLTCLWASCFEGYYQGGLFEKPNGSVVFYGKSVAEEIAPDREDILDLTMNRTGRGKSVLYALTAHETAQLIELARSGTRKSKHIELPDVRRVGFSDDRGFCPSTIQIASHGGGLSIGCGYIPRNIRRNMVAAMEPFKVVTV